MEENDLSFLSGRVETIDIEEFEKNVIINMESKIEKQTQKKIKIHEKNLEITRKEKKRFLFLLENSEDLITNKEYKKKVFEQKISCCRVHNKKHCATNKEN